MTARGGGRRRATRVRVLMGGDSPERDVSLRSGAACAEALRASGYEVDEIDVDRRIVTHPSFLDERGPCFNALHGGSGENGEIQGLLEMSGIPYTHSGVCASALAADKWISKKIFSAAGLPVAEAARIGRDAVASGIPFPPPYVLKPIYGGSGIGLRFVSDARDVADGDADGDAGGVGASDHGPLMAERYVPGREFTCAVIGDAVSDVLEILPSGDLYDYAAKYEDDASRFDVPANVPSDLAERIRDVTFRAHALLGCRGATRSDFRFDPDEGRLALLEVNTQPGMTQRSLLPRLALARGMSFEDLVRDLTKDASCRR